MNYQQHLANSAAIRTEIQRFESVHPNIYELLERVEEPLLQNQIREHVIAIEDVHQCPGPQTTTMADTDTQAEEAHTIGKESNAISLQVRMIISESAQNEHAHQPNPAAVVCCPSHVGDEPVTLHGPASTLGQPWTPRIESGSWHGSPPAPGASQGPQGERISTLETSPSPECGSQVVSPSPQHVSTLTDTCCPADPEVAYCHLAGDYSWILAMLAKAALFTVIATVN
ncbi:Arf-GAP with GTPase, ANK repeat and PH domain-containing protein 1 [Merluccius polli]|uniref:Arf-GAP with GTPase, ANK repeat and PH domain-containing protein 1 n=1 Tax=Merluccius polli TaxID=89951 RepID=A0AA47N7A4_MERPO|nr:Arf-GAP with GTPase, ANK repeat and PH domain-containing protein 1 [Merluccius polli]